MKGGRNEVRRTGRPLRRSLWRCKAHADWRAKLVPEKQPAKAVDVASRFDPFVETEVEMEPRGLIHPGHCPPSVGVGILRVSMVVLCPGGHQLCVRQEIEMILGQISRG